MHAASAALGLRRASRLDVNCGSNLRPGRPGGGQLPRVRRALHALRWRLRPEGQPVRPAHGRHRLRPHAALLAGCVRAAGGLRSGAGGRRRERGARSRGCQRAKRRARRVGRLAPRPSAPPRGRADPALDDGAERAQDHVSSTAADVSRRDNAARAHVSPALHPPSARRWRARGCRPPPVHAAPSPVRPRPRTRGATEAAAGPAPSHAAPPPIPTGLEASRAAHRPERAPGSRSAPHPGWPCLRVCACPHP